MAKALPDPEELTYEEALEALEAIVQRAESGELPLEEAMAEHARGEALLKPLSRCWTARKHSFVPLIKRPPTLRTKTPSESETQLFLLEHGGPMVLLLLLGGSMGSFLNVVVDRGSRGVSIVRPGSQCPNCGLRLRFGRENLPLLGWLAFARPMPSMSARHPSSVSADGVGVAFAFVGVYQLAFDPFGCGGTMDPWLEATGARESVFYFLGVLALMSGFFAAGVIDFRTYHIPMWITTALR